MDVSQLPMGSAPDPVACPHFPDRLHAFVWRNWQLIPAERLAGVIGAQPEQICEIAGLLGLSQQPEITEDQQRRTYVTIIRRNWHLLPYEQLIELLGWTVEKMDFVLREGDGLFWWMGNYKPRIDRLRYEPPTAEARARALAIGAAARSDLGADFDRARDPLLSFIGRLSEAPASASPTRRSAFVPRFCYSYFGSFRNALSSDEDCYPEGYLAQLAAAGVDGVWLHEPLYHLAPFPWDERLGAHREEYIRNLRALVARAKRHGIGVYIYLNEPRPMPLAFFDEHPELKGIEDVGVLRGQLATLCTSVPEVHSYLRDGMAYLCAAVPDLAGVFTITASESYTNCWSHDTGNECPRCGKRSPQEVIAEVNAVLHEGIREAGSECKLIVWDWGWRDEWAPGIIQRLPPDAWFMSVSEWSMPINRGGVESEVGEYSLSVIGPGPRATRHWKLAKDRGLKTVARITASSTWELAAVPYIPVVANVAQHAANLRHADVDGLMLSWTLGGYPSPNLEAIIAIGEARRPSVEAAMEGVARRRFGAAAPAVVEAWSALSAAFREYPFACASLYQSPVHMGPANLLWGEATGYEGVGTMAFAHPVDDLEAWRTIYPPAAFAAQFKKVADGFDHALAALKERGAELSLDPIAARALDEETGIVEACAIHLRSVYNQVRFVMARRQLDDGSTPDEARALIATLDEVLHSEIALATRLHALQSRDSRIGFEAACQYFYIAVDLAEKIVNCRDLLARWMPQQRAKHGVM
ncbi:MAG: hypothetical protein JSV65_15160 [Armatimonadota bacterium]|nr:MAG: hypothetical protein JSV65_15160 [Armatimonadota bacterium]